MATRRRAVPAKRKAVERQSQRELLGWCATNLRLGVVWQHIENEDAVQAENAHARHKARVMDGMLEGAPDLAFYWQGRAFFLELKKGDGVVSDAQDRCHARLRAAGCPVEVAYSLREAQDVLTSWGLARAQRHDNPSLSWVRAGAPSFATIRAKLPQRHPCPALIAAFFQGDPSEDPP